MSENQSKFAALKEDIGKAVENLKELPSKIAHAVTDKIVDGVKTAVPQVANIRERNDAAERAAMGEDPTPLPTPGTSGSTGRTR